MRTKNESAEQYFKDSEQAAKVQKTGEYLGHIEATGEMVRLWQLIWTRYKDATPEEKENYAYVATEALKEIEKENYIGILLASTKRFIDKYSLSSFSYEYQHYCLQVFLFGVAEGYCQWNNFGGKRLYKWGKVGDSSFVKPEDVPPAVLNPNIVKQKGVKRDMEWKERVERAKKEPK